MDVTAQYATVYVNGTLSGTDSTGLAGSERNDTVSIGANRNATNTLYEYVDNMSLYKWAFTTAQITDVYNNRTSNYTITSGGGGGSTYKGIDTYRSGSLVAKIRSGSQIGYTRRVGTVGSDVVEVFKEDFEDWDLDYFDENDVIQKYQSSSFMWLNEYDNRITTATGKGNVWESYYPAGRVGGDAFADGFGFGIPLGDEYTEMWLQQDIYVGYGFDAYNNALADGGGKVLPGFMGGPSVHVPYSVLPAIADSFSTGWMLHGMFVPLNSGALTILDLYMYWPNMYDIWDTDWGYAVYGTGPYLYNIWNPGSWHTFTMRVKLNDFGQKNGFVEAFWDGVFQDRQEDMQFRTNTETDGITKYIDKIFEGFWFGGSTPSDNPNTIMYDNILAYYYQPGHPDYRSGYSAAGSTIDLLPVTGTKYAADFFTDETFTASADTIVGYDGSWSAPAMLEGDYCTKTINVAGAVSITLDFYYWEITHVYTAWTRTMGYVQVRNSSNNIVYTFNAQNIPTTPVTVTGETVYLRYFSGRNEIDGGWKCDYTANF